MKSTRYTDISNLPEGHPDKAMAEASNAMLKALSDAKLSFFQGVVTLANVQGNFILHFSGTQKQGEKNGTIKQAAYAAAHIEQFVGDILAVELGDKFGEYSAELLLEHLRLIGQRKNDPLQYEQGNK